MSLINWHRHQWVSVALSPMKTARFDQRIGLQIGPWSPITVVLQKCQCGAVCTKTLDGTWTVADLVVRGRDDEKPEYPEDADDA